MSCKYNNAWKPLKFIVTDEHTKTIIGKRDAINLKCIQFLDRACDPNKDFAFVGLPFWSSYPTKTFPKGYG